MILRPGPLVVDRDLAVLSRDGLIRPIADAAWVPWDLTWDPGLRADSLSADPTPGLAASHATAAWIWWGREAHQGTLEFSTLRLRRVRASRAEWIHEASLDRDDLRRVAGRIVTSPVRTVIDLLRSEAMGQRHTPAELARVPAEVAAEAMQRIAAMRRRPHLAELRRLAAKRLVEG